MGVRFENKENDYFRKVTIAMDSEGGGLDAASFQLSQEITESMYLSGATDLPEDTPVSGQPASAPGKPPSVKTGRLANSFTNARLGTLRWGAGTNVVYARIHEFGGTIQHPGGTHYFMKDGKPVFVSEKAALQMALEGKELATTKPHPITLPARPAMRPALRKGKKRVQEAFNRAMKKKMGGSL